jgi:branched-chain amino acid aminotransferase
VNYINLNGKLQRDDQPALLVSNRGYRYGDGLFETMKVINGRINLAPFHFERLFSGLSLLKFEMPKHFAIKKLTDEILNLCKKNDCEQLARVRLSVFRGNGGLYDDDRSLQYAIESWPLSEPVNKLNENGLVIDVYRDARKSCDIFSNLKSANFLPYAMAAVFAKENKWNDCLVLNTSGHIADVTIANLFIIRDGIITTPALNEGCVNGVMRRYLLEKLPGSGFKTKETSVLPEDVENADEVFLTNAIHGIRWVRQFRDKIYSNAKTKEIYDRFITIFVQ